MLAPISRDESCVRNRFSYTVSWTTDGPSAWVSNTTVGPVGHEPWVHSGLHVVSAKVARLTPEPNASVVHLEMTAGAA